MRFSLVVCSGVLAALLVPAPPLRAAPAAAHARSGYVVATTRRLVNNRLDALTAQLWFTRTRTRVSLRRGRGPALIEVFDGKTVYRWTDASTHGRRWHPTGVQVLSDVVAQVLGSERTPGRKRVGTGTVAGLRCVLYEGELKAPADGSAWWKGTLKVRTWESQDPRFPYVLKSTAQDASGNRVESEVTRLALNVPVDESLFRPPPRMTWSPPPQIRRGVRVAGGGVPITAKVSLYLGDALGSGAGAKGRRVVVYQGSRIALDAKALATERDLDEVRLEPYGTYGVPFGQALVLYLKPAAAAALARVSPKAKGRRLVVLVGGEVASAARIDAPRALENNRVAVFDTQRRRLDQLARRINPRFAPGGL
ncbi:MAG: hypothetical protein QHJ73_01575 [Armatimonadota bacterium]|nr:hypothetical protein [Armatimonadota bacterium]